MHVYIPKTYTVLNFGAMAARRYGCERIIHLESDTCIRAKTAAGHMAQPRRGRTVLWCNSQERPEAAVQVLCGPCIDEMAARYQRGAPFWVTAHQGNEIPEGAPV